MKLRQPEKNEPDINLTPLIDVVFLLLIFFMVSTTFQRDAALTIELPEATAEAAVADKQSIEIAIDAQGRFYVQGRQLINTQTRRSGAIFSTSATKLAKGPLVRVT